MAGIQIIVRLQTNVPRESIGVVASALTKDRARRRIREAVAAALGEYDPDGPVAVIDTPQVTLDWVPDVPQPDLMPEGMTQIGMDGGEYDGR